VRRISLPQHDRSRAVLWLAGTWSVVGLGIYGWVDAQPKFRPFARATQAAPSRTAGAHSNGKVHFDILSKLLADDRRSRAPDEWLRDLAQSPASFRVETQDHHLVGHAAPEFTLDDHQGCRWNLSERLARGPVVVVFYLGYYCNACVHHLFELNADVDRFRSLDAEVVAISGDEPETTRTQFERYEAFNFPVLNDPDHRVAQSFGVFVPATEASPDSVLHGTFLIDRHGQVRWARYGDTPFRNSKALLYELARVEGKLPRRQSALVAADEDADQP
jgi:peroxiredoxin